MMGMQMETVKPFQQNHHFPTKSLAKYRAGVNINAITFWLLFALNYLFLNRILLIMTYGKFRLGAFVLFWGFLHILLYRRLAQDIPLALVLVTHCFVVLLSASINRTPLLQFATFVRIPIVFYLIYHLVVFFLNSKARVARVFRYMYTIAAFQLPVIALQRIAYPWLPDRLKFGSITGELSLVDFGMGTFTGDTSMAFTLIGLIILLLFDPHIRSIVKRKWLMAGWLSSTVLFSNSQIQHITVVLIWVIYLLSHLKIKTIVIGIVMLALLAGTLNVLFQLGVMTFPPLSHTFARLSKISLLLEGDAREEKFLEGGHAREGAIYYYMHQPIKWIGEGPGSAYNTIARQRSIGSWGHVFTFYAEVGLIGLGLSILAFFVIASPICFGPAGKLWVNWVGTLMFLAVNIVAFVKYPMGNSAHVFTYCVILIGHRVLANPSE
jgi:hypothetical protein